MRPAPRLVVGIGNPGRRYTSTRHNAGLQFLEMLGQSLETRPVRRFTGPGRLLEVRTADERCWLLASGTFMNDSGTGVARARDYLGLVPGELLVAHDELDLEPGIATLKEGGGLGGHRGLQDITTTLRSRDYCRLRIGIGRPEDRSRVTGYVLSPPDERQLVLMRQAMERAAAVVPDVLNGRMQIAMRVLHTGNKAA